MKDYFATEFVRAVDETKRIYLMCEHLGNGKVNEFKEATANLTIDTQDNEISPEEYVKALTAFVKEKVSPLIPKDTYQELIFGDYEVYTDEHHHRRFWNEIPIPDIALNWISEYKKIAGLDYQHEKTNYLVSVYDLNEDGFYFKTEKEMEDFLKIEDVAPFTAMILIDNIIYDELYSA